MQVVRVVRALILVLAFGQAIGVSDFVDMACAEDCGDQDCDDGACPPICPSCHCVTRLAANAVGAIATLGRPLTWASSAAFFDTDDAPPSPDPTEILRVPIVLAG